MLGSRSVFSSRCLAFMGRFLASALLSWLISFPVIADVVGGELDGNGLECEIIDKKYERDKKLKYFSFENGEVFWLVASDANGGEINRLSHGGYFVEQDEVRWYPYTFNRKTLRLDKLRPSYPGRAHDCRLMTAEEIQGILKRQLESFKG